MRLNDYQAATQRTAGDKMTLEHIALGTAGEAGELADEIKKHVYHGHDLDVDHLINEGGDVLWYLARLATRLGTTLEEMASRNLRKLEKRYPNGFSEERSINRASDR